MFRTTICVTLLAIALVNGPPEGGRYATSDGERYERQQEPPRFRVGVDAVRIDAVVVDRNGRVVPDLTADDFEIRQDGKLQKVTFAEFVPVLTSAPPAPSANPSTPAPSTTVVAAPAQVKRENVQRTFAIVVDDLGLSVESFINARKALHTFVDREIRPNDLVALVRTGGSLDGLQPFTMDRRVLHAAIEALHWNGFSRNGVEAFEPVNSFTTFDRRGSQISEQDFSAVNQLRSSISAAGTMGALNLVIRGARDLPGRKALVVVSEGFELVVNDKHAGAASKQPDFRVRNALDRVIDQATRAGVVIYALDARGLQTAGLQASDNLKSPDPRDKSLEESARRFSGERLEVNRNTQETLAYLSEQTGGFAVVNTNDLGRGMGRIVEDVRDYYVIGYVPDGGTFKRIDNKVKLHNVSVKVRRPGVRVKTRKSFFGISDSDEPPSQLTPSGQLIHAAVSPFVATDIALRATTLPGYAPESGMFVRTLLHIDAHALTFADTADGKKTASADVLGMAFDQDGTEVAHLSTGFAVALTAQATEDVLRDGLVYNLRIPIRRPGAYQVRFAIRDQNSGAIGSAGEFVEIPDVTHGAFALSGIVMRAAEESDASPITEGITVTPAQALRTYAAGSQLTYAYEIYNATGAVRSSTTVWRGIQKVLDAAPATLKAPAGGERRFAAAGGIRLGEQLPPGKYMLQITATAQDPKREGRALTAVQRITFDVR